MARSSKSSAQAWQILLVNSPELGPWQNWFWMRVLEAANVTHTSSLDWTTLEKWEYFYGWTTQALDLVSWVFAIFRGSRRVLHF